MGEAFHSVPTPRTAGHYLRGIDFPKDKNQIIAYAKAHQAPEDVLEIMQRMPKAVYRTMSDVWQGFGQVS